jgi:hypothetical protein
MLATFFVVLAVGAMAGGQSAIAGAAKTKVGKSHLGKTHRPTKKKHPHCVITKPKRAHKKRTPLHKGHAKNRRSAHLRKLKKCPASRPAPKKPLIPTTPLALLPSLPGAIAPTLTPPVPTVTAPTTPPGTTVPPPVGKPSPTSKNCIEKPSACGYPDATNTGVPAGTKLTSESNDITVTKAGTTISGIALTSSIAVDADNTTIKDSEITVDGTQTCGESCGGRGIWIAPGVTGTVIEHVTCHGGAASGNDVTQYCIANNSSSTKVSYLYAYNCTECFTGPGNLSNSFLDVTGTIPGEHYEDIYYGGGAGPLIVNHDTMLNPQAQTAVVFTSVDFGDQTEISITDNLMAGGGYVIYGGGSGSGGSVTGPITVTGNRFSRKYYPEGGFYGLAGDFVDGHTTWSENIWDETLKQAPQ